MKRRQFNRSISLLGLSTILPFSPNSAQASMIHRAIPSSGEQIPVIGMGSWLTFDVKGNRAREEQMKAVLQTFLQLGGRVVDSSPMYGSSEEVIGKLARELRTLDDLWISTKIWTDGKANGQRQLHNSNELFANRVMVNHVHNIRDFSNHFDTLQQAKSDGLIKYTGITHYLNSYHDELAKIIRTHTPDFIQINYNIENPNAGERLIPLAADRGIAIIINRPFQTGRLFERVGSSALPNWAGEFGINNWAAFMLKYIISNPDVTCTIPATTQVAHVEQNLLAGTGPTPSPADRERMRNYFLSVI